MTETLLRALESSIGEIYTTAGDCRVLFAKCKAAIEIYERMNRVSTLDGESYNVRTGYRVLLRCSAVETTRNADVNFLRTQSGFDFSGDFQRKDGCFERIGLALVPVTIDLCGGDWDFHVNGSGELVKKLIAL